LFLPVQQCSRLGDVVGIVTCPLPPYQSKVEVRVQG
jgi:hypothetical protein